MKFTSGLLLTLSFCSLWSTQVYAAAKQIGSSAQTLEQQNRKFKALQAFSQALNSLENMYVEEEQVTTEALVDKALKGITSGLDPHTVYLPPQALKDLTTDASGKFEGIGIVLSSQGDHLEIVEVLPQSPAARAGVQAGEIIYAVDGAVAQKNNHRDLLTKMKGALGTPVKLELYLDHNYSQNGSKKNIAKNKDSKPQTRIVTLNRELIKTSSVNHKELSLGYIYIKVSGFQEETAKDIDEALQFYETRTDHKLGGVVLDLRNNPGGLLDQAIKTVNLFIDSGIIVSTIGRNNKQEVEYANKHTAHPKVPMVVLVNEGSASASEIVAGALQDHNRALIMGTTTFGKGSVQLIVPLTNDGGIKVTVARYYTPKGRSIQARGIIPDIVLPTPEPTATSKSTPKPETGLRKEADLEGHIAPNDLGISQKDSSFTADTGTWPEPMQDDFWLRTAYVYLKSWNRFSQQP